ncbi:MAG: FtsX-like permease family protein [Rectinema sp.]
MTILSFGARNLLRNRRRSVLASTSVFLSIAMIVILQGFTSGFMDSLVRNYTKNETGHINIATAGYRERSIFSPVDDYIADSDTTAAILSEALNSRWPGTRIAQRIRFGVVLGSGNSTKAAVAISGDPETERSLLMLDKRILSGAYIGAPGDAVLGAGLAADLGLKAGDSLKVLTEKSDGGLRFKKFRISGLFKTGVNSMDDSVFQIGLDDARTLLGMENGAQQLLVMLPHRSDTAAAAEAATAALDSRSADLAGQKLSVLPWTKIGEYPRLVAMMDSIYLWIWIVVALLGAFVIANVMTMAVLERKREIGILMSMGMPANRIRSLFLLEGSLLGFAGGLAGGVAGTVFNAVFARIGFDMTSSMAGFSWPMDNVIHPSVNIGTALLSVVFGMLAAALMSWIPARNAARIAPVEAIRAV